MEGQTADGSDPLSHEAVVVLDVADHISVGVVDGDELVHGAAACVVRKRGEKKQCLKQLSNILCQMTRWFSKQELPNVEIELETIWMWEQRDDTMVLQCVKLEE